MLLGILFTQIAAQFYAVVQFMLSKVSSYQSANIKINQREKPDATKKIKKYVHVMRYDFTLY